jgi:hypothetical protein
LSYIIAEGIDRKMDMSYSQKKELEVDIEKLLYSEVPYIEEIRENLSNLKVFELKAEVIFELFFNYYLYSRPKVIVILAKKIKVWSRFSGTIILSCRIG